jgi:hypothetical protein
MNAFLVLASLIGAAAFAPARVASKASSLKMAFDASKQIGAQAPRKILTL